MKLNKLKSFGFAAALGMALPLTAFAGGDKADKDAHFKMMDTDGDGKVSSSEHDASVRKKHEMMDANKDGKVTAEEMTAAKDKMGKKAKPGEMTAAEKIKMLDKDGDGALSADEHTSGAKELFATMDGDKDGFLTKTELAAGHDKSMKKPVSGKDSSSTAKDKAPAAGSESKEAPPPSAPAPK
jgi:Ca2+-binding EF-hand superfamily protein